MGRRHFINGLVEQGREEQGQQELRVHPHRGQAGQEGAAEAGAGQQEDLRHARQLRQREQQPDRGEDEGDEFQVAHGAPPPGKAGPARAGPCPLEFRPPRDRPRLAMGA